LAAPAVVTREIMSSNLSLLIFLIGAIFSPIAASMAFLITYEEYSHHYPDGRKPLQLSIQAAAFTLIVLLGLSVLIAFFVARIF
jgi:hypothetical protein